jgi:hypothetical protein
MKQATLSTAIHVISELIKNFEQEHFKNTGKKHMFSFLDKDNPYDMSSLHWDEYGNPFIYFGDSGKNE